MRVLLVAYDFPPVGGIGVQRVLKFARYLPAHGIEPVVLTPAHSAGRALDPDLLARNGLQALPVLRRGGERAAAWLQWRETRQGPRPWRDMPALALSALRHGDIYGSWFDDVHPALPGIVAAHGIDAVWTTVPQNTTALLGLALSREAGVPWVLDVRDSIGARPAAAGASLSAALLAGRARCFEREVLGAADRIVAVSQGIIDSAAARVGDAVRARSTVIENGFDPADMPALATHANDKLTLAYAGTFHGNYSPRTLVDGINLGIAGGAIDPALLRLHFYGRHDAAVQVMLDALDPRVECRRHGFVPHAQALAGMAAADVALLFTVPGDAAGAREILTGKLFECMGMRRYVLALADAQPLRQLVADAGIGECCAATAPRAVAGALAALQQRWRRDGHIVAPVNEAVIARYDRRVQAGVAADVLRAAVAGRKGVGR